MSNNPEKDLVERAQNGESFANAELFKKYWRAARAAAFGITGNIDMAEDASAEALYLAFRDIKNLKDAGKFGPWLHKIAVRSAKRLNFNEIPSNIKNSEIFPGKTDSDSIPDIEKREISALIQEAVSNLDGIFREVMSLYYFEGYTIEQIANFLDVPIGTIKRRLHNGRIALKTAAQEIIKGNRPVNINREDIIKQLNDFIEKGGDYDEFLKVIWKGTKLRPLPYELLAKIFSKHSPVAKKLADPQERKKYVLHAHKVMGIISKPSNGFRDPNHPVGKIANEIKSALSEFKEREVDADAIAENIIKLHTTGDVNSSSSLPPGFAQGVPGSFISYTRQSLFEKENGSIYTMYELDWPKDKSHIKGNPFISEALHLIWLRTEKIELQSVEQLLRNLVSDIVPQVKYFFSSLNGPRFSSGLRINFEGITMPAATGGINFMWPGLPEGVSVASVLLYLETWASVKSGQKIELSRLDSYLQKLHKIEGDESYNNPD